MLGSAVSRALLRVDELEEVIVGVCLKHHGVESGLGLLVEGGASPSHRQLLQNLFVYISGLERRLQVRTASGGRGAIDVTMPPSGTG